MFFPCGVHLSLFLSPQDPEELIFSATVPGAEKVDPSLPDSSVSKGVSQHVPPPVSYVPDVPFFCFLSCDVQGDPFLVPVLVIKQTISDLSPSVPPAPVRYAKGIHQTPLLQFQRLLSTPLLFLSSRRSHQKTVTLPMFLWCIIQWFQQLQKAVKT